MGTRSLSAGSVFSGTIVLGSTTAVVEPVKAVNASIKALCWVNSFSN